MMLETWQQVSGAGIRIIPFSTNTEQDERTGSRGRI